MATTKNDNDGGSVTRTGHAVCKCAWPKKNQVNDWHLPKSLRQLVQPYSVVSARKCTKMWFSSCSSVGNEAEHSVHEYPPPSGQHTTHNTVYVTSQWDLRTKPEGDHMQKATETEAVLAAQEYQPTNAVCFKFPQPIKMTPLPISGSAAQHGMWMSY